MYLHQSALYEIKFGQNRESHLILNSHNGEMKWDGKANQTWGNTTESAPPSAQNLN